MRSPDPKQTQAIDYRLLFEALPGLYLILDPVFTIIAASDAYLAATLTRRIDIIGRGLFEVFPDNPDDPSANGESNLRSSLERVIRDKVADTMAVQKYDIRRPENEGGGFELRFWSPRNSPVLDGNGELRFIIHQVEDVTQFVQLKNQGTEQSKIAAELRTRTGQMESEILRRSQDLQDSNDKLREANRELAATEAERDRFFSISLDMLCIAGIDGYFKRLNPAFEATLGFTAEELCSRPLLEFVHPDDVAPTLAEIERQSRGIKVLSFENRYRCKDGSYRWLSWKSVPVGTLMYALARDITEDKRNQHELIDARQTALEAAQAKSEFLANMSHEIRTPLNAIIGMTDLTLETALNVEQQQYLQVVRVAGENLLRIINDILDVSKIEAGKMELEASEFSLVALVESTVDLMTSRARAQSLGLSWFVDPQIPDSLVGDPGRIGQVLLNFLSNAIKFTKMGGIALRVTCDSCPSAAEVILRFSVTDTGIGLNDDQIAKLFRPFTQADNSTSRKYGGTGLGLSISKRLSELMGGEIGVESAEAVGSTFWFTAKLRRNDKAPEVSRQIEESTIPPKFSLTIGVPVASQHSRILLAEDNPVNQQLAQLQLEKIGFHNVQTVGNGQEVLAALSRGGVDLILMDCQMPEMDGFATAREIRRREASSGHRLPIIAMTAHALKGDKEKCFDAGMDDYVVKPVKRDRLREVLTKWLVSREPDCIDMETIRDLEQLNVPGQPDMISQVVATFLKSTELSLSQLVAAEQTADIATVKSLAHTLKASCGGVGANQLAELMRRLEQAAHCADMTSVREIIAAVPPAYAMAHERLSALAEKRRKAA